MRKKALEKIKRELKSARNVLIAVHIDPDGDAIGSALALVILLEQLGVVADIYSQDGIPKVYRFLPGADKVKNKIPLGKHYNLIITVDSSDISRVGDKVSLREVASRILNIDHHPDNTLFGDVNYVEKLSSVAEQIYYIARSLKIKIDRKMAECLYVAMITDTGNFRYENTSASTFLMAAELLQLGIDTHEITTRIYDTKSVPSIRIFALALACLQFSEDRKVAWTAVSEEMMGQAVAKGEDLIGLVDQIRSIERVEVAILFREEKGKVKVNFRSKYKVNVSEIAKRFGGGGHLKAAGAVIVDPLEKARDKVIAETLKYLEASKYLV